jgi:hypothetical protein
MAAMRLYVIRVDIYEAATDYAFPIVRHEFIGRSPAEARRYHAAHMQSDAFLRQCEQKGLFNGAVKCRATKSEGWTES